MTDCEFCEVRKFIGSVFDLHWLDDFDCPYKYDCPNKSDKVSEVKEETNDND